MKYFAKYLPVEGEIKPDDKILFGDKLATQGAVLYVIYHDDLKNILLNTQEQIDSRKKVKLFLCSRDINSNDELLPVLVNQKIDYEYHKYGSQEFDSYDQWFNANIKWIKSLEPFKVIGEISPEATWVKEGDEFDLKDFNPLSAAAIEHKEPLTATIRIKGPCGHFH